MEANLQFLAYGFDGGIHFGQDLVLACVEEFVPRDDLRPFHEQPPELDKVTITRPLPFERRLHELVELGEALAGALEFDAMLAGGVLVVLAKTRDARGRNALRVA